MGRLVRVYTGQGSADPRSLRSWLQILTAHGRVTSVPPAEDIDPPSCALFEALSGALGI